MVNAFKGKQSGMQVEIEHVASNYQEKLVGLSG